MRIHFRATDGGFDEDEYALLCGVNGCGENGVEHAISFDRLCETAATEDPQDDWGVHTQFDDQSNGAYNRVLSCRLSKGELVVDLAGQLGRLVGVEGFDVELAIADDIYDSVRNGLTRIFRGTNILIVE